ncbi:MAG: hypothetical protein BWZ10_03191 [candidate division BRC1 bacterium ADurb.BinA364]|nr:MAG: hypothetical protein BWZ10_03191 [candidate division BRC1 bacterium ADurb.BinA364]
MRQRSILTADGFERHELELVVQNQSEQFLKLVLPRKRETIEIHEIRIAGRLVKPVFRQEDGQDALLVPLIRTGLLEPEATVRVVYSAQTGDKFGGSGKRVYAMPRVLGGAPVAESAMVLMLPREYRYDDFEGSMKRAELTDLEVDEAMRESKRIEKISEAVLLAEGQTQQIALGRLMDRQSQVEKKMKAAESISMSQKRAFFSNRLLDYSDEEAQLEERLTEERYRNLGIIQESNEAIRLNLDSLSQIVSQQQVQQAAQIAVPQAIALPSPPPPSAAAEAPPLEFPRQGEAFVFRQFQGAGTVEFEYKALAKLETRKDWLWIAGGAALLWLLALAGPWALASRRRTVLIGLALCLALIVFKVAADAAILGSAALLSYLLLSWKRAASAGQG